MKWNKMKNYPRIIFCNREKFKLSVNYAYVMKTQVDTGAFLIVLST